MKTDLSKILSVGGQPGLHRYLTQSSGGVVVESLSDGKRKWMGPSARMTSLSDISVYTQTDEELKLQDVFVSMKEYLKDEQAPAPGKDPAEMAAFFEKVIPQYDRNRFYPSHMKKVLEWYNLLKSADALDFEEAEGKEEAAAAAEPVAKKPAAKTIIPAAKAAKPVAAKAPKPVQHTTQK
ncbi:MAG TPA: DUF5606 domain-containing protein [Bacteroidales bacterium]|jgi:hypothetical protein|nr:DUF5606 domain-containing protein [Bacteroidales bacterium]MCZ2418030.1 DUF5606 domain-containing protein [Burkholderiales bacterium]OQC56683.1 MAG: hypothetical protein BWX52_01539 [Bacteroidetes bacterium ADurb.Bin013]MCZ2316101.1 DUF5606 domain-containing protein [Bacteroidales bacterium]NLZ08849.1 DUF5606 domain-containing protein [Bacteroidales bacterium]